MIHTEEFTAHEEIHTTSFSSLFGNCSVVFHTYPGTAACPGLSRPDPRWERGALWEPTLPTLKEGEEMKGRGKEEAAVGPFCFFLSFVTTFPSVQSLCCHVAAATV